MYKIWKRIYNYHFHRDRDFARRMKVLLGFMPCNLTIFRNAFSHKSGNHELNNSSTNNERLEFLGDALLSSIVADYLYSKFQKEKEGFLTKMRSKIVKRSTLNIIAQKMGLDILLAEQNDTHISNSMLGNAFEALVGAIYVDKGYAFVRSFLINRVLLEYLDMKSLEESDDNFKSALLEFCQKRGKDVQFKLVNKYKFQKRDRFVMAVFVNGAELAQAEGFNKKSAEQEASKKALNAIGRKSTKQYEEAMG